MDQDISKLENYREKIAEFVKDKLSLKVHPGKQFIRTVSSGIDFVGYITRPDYVLIRKRIVGDWRKKMEKIKSPENKKRAYESYLAHSVWANTFGLRQRMANFAKIS